MQAVLINQRCREYEWIRVVEFQYSWLIHTQNFMSTYTTNFWETFHGNFICSQMFCLKSAERKSLRKYFFIFSFWCLTCCLNRDLSSNKSTHYLLHWGDFCVVYNIVKMPAITSLDGVHSKCLIFHDTDIQFSPILIGFEDRCSLWLSLWINIHLQFKKFSYQKEMICP